MVADPDIGTAQWIWTQEQPFNSPAGGPRAFVKKAAIPSGAHVDSMVIDITCDNYYTLYVNGCLVGNGTNWTIVQRYSIKFPRTNNIHIAVYAANDPVGLGPAGVIASASMWDSTNYTGSTFTIKTDASWITSILIAVANLWDIVTNPTGGKFKTDASWITSITDVSGGSKDPDYHGPGSWGAVRVEGPYGMGPWNAVAKPTTTSAVTGGFADIHEVPDAPPAPLATNGQYSKAVTPL